VKSFLRDMANRAVLISVSSALSQTPAYTARLVHHVMFPLTLQLSLALTVPTHYDIGAL